MKSRRWQYLQHLVGGSYQILLTLMAVSFGAGDTITGIIIAILTFIVNRASSEIQYQVQKNLLMERHEL